MPFVYLRWMWRCLFTWLAPNFYWVCEHANESTGVYIHEYVKEYVYEYYDDYAHECQEVYVYACESQHVYEYANECF